MRTSVSQFEMMINYMEQNGDITKPTKDSRGRLRAIDMWEALTTLLNSDGSGVTKSVEQWKKVWSDLKNNTKRKAARISRAALRTGGGPACTTRLSELEQKVLQIIGPQAATGTVAVAEAGFPQRQTAAEADSNRTATLPSPEPDASPSIIQLAQNDYSLSGNNVFGYLWNEESLAAVDQLHMADQQDSGNRAVSYVFMSTPAREGQAMGAAAAASPVRGPSTEPAVVPTPTRMGHTPQRPRRLRRRSPTHHRSNRPRPASSHMEQTAQRFAQSDQEWRNFLKLKYQQEMELKEKELACQQRWQEISQSVVSILDRAVDKM